MADHLSRLDKGSHGETSNQVTDDFPDEQLLEASHSHVLCFADYVNFFACQVLPLGLTSNQKKRFLHDVRTYLWDESFLFMCCSDQFNWRCVPEEEMESILHYCHVFIYGGYFGWVKTAMKVLQSVFYWPSLFKGSNLFVLLSDCCQRGNYLLSSINAT